jgi:8-oxo-dGTP diphosphatase
MSARQPAGDDHYHPCPAGRHWGPRGAAGILPWTATPDGRTWVLLSHRSPHVQAGGTWSTFGGAIDEGETPWETAVRETGEEIRGIDLRVDDVTAELRVPCPYGCGWSYTTFTVRVEPGEDYLPRVRIALASAWETDAVRWVPTGRIAAWRGLHPGLQAAWPALRQAIIAEGG